MGSFMGGRLRTRDYGRGRGVIADRSTLRGSELLLLTYWLSKPDRALLAAARRGNLSGVAQALCDGASLRLFGRDALAVAARTLDTSIEAVRSAQLYGDYDFLDFIDELSRESIGVPGALCHERDYAGVCRFLVGAGVSPDGISMRDLKRELPPYLFFKQPGR